MHLLKTEQRRRYSDQVVGWMIRVSDSGMDKRCFSSPKPAEELWSSPVFQFNGYRGSFSGVKLLSRKVNHSYPSHAKVKNQCNYMSIPYMLSRHGQGKTLRFTEISFRKFVTFMLWCPFRFLGYWTFHLKIKFAGISLHCTKVRRHINRTNQNIRNTPKAFP